jgi:site-specific DNA-methyltransferase (adenine-specific)
MIDINKIYCESNLDTMAKMPNDFIDLVVTSPPYDNLRDYKGFDFPFKEIAIELFRVIKIGGCLVWVVSDQTKDGCESGTSFKQALFFMDCGFNLHDTMIYHKHSTPLTHNRYEQHFEYMFVLSKGKPKTFNPITEKKIWEDNRKFKKMGREKDGSYDVGKCSKSTIKIKGNVWKYNIGGGHVTVDSIAHNHPAIFPEQLVADHIYSWSNEGDLIYDCFMGSGTTAKMAHLQKRNWIGSELSQEYCDIANKRLIPYLTQTVLF